MKLLQRKKGAQRGFSLIELMIVIAIIGLLIAVGVPAWGYMIRNGNETAAITMTKQIADRQAQYYSKRKEFAADFEKLGKETGFNENFKGAETTFNGYVFRLKTENNTAGKPNKWLVTADPESPSTGSRHFYTDSNLSTIKVAEDGEANAGSPSL